MSFILTLRFDQASQSFFEKMRRTHFPAERNQIAAHLTLFHQLPGTRDVLGSIEDVANSQAHFPLTVTGLRSLGRGVAYILASPVLLEAHRRLASSLEEYLIPQDKQRFMPHVVIQNKATADRARALLQELQVGFAARTVEAQGFDLWQYLGGPWKHEQTFPFSVQPVPNMQLKASG